MSKIKDNQKAFIVMEAGNLFLTNSIEKVTMSDIAKDVGIGEATLYRYFGKKENIVVLAGSSIWHKIKEKYFTLDQVYKETNGYEKIKHFFEVFINIYKEDQLFLSFIDDFDQYIINHEIGRETLKEYDKELFNIKNIFDNYFEKGVYDGSISSYIDRDCYYYSSTHALLSLCGKLSRQGILESDEKYNAIQQIELLIKMITNYIKNRKG